MPYRRIKLTFAISSPDEFLVFFWYQGTTEDSYMQFVLDADRPIEMGDPLVPVECCSASGVQTSRLGLLVSLTVEAD